MMAYFRGRWPEAEAPDGEPLWLNYEVDMKADVVLRTVDVFADGRITRNSIVLEERNGASCSSLIDGSFHEQMGDAPLERITSEEFGRLWEQGEDKPFWFVE